MELTHSFDVGFLRNVDNPYNPADRVYKWIPTDTEEAFHKRLKKDPTNPSLLYYLENPISYKLNNKGFRTPIDFVDGIEGNVFLGCSHTFGIGLHLENIWAWKLNEYIGGNFLNLGVGGTGIGTGFRLLYQLKEMIRPKNVFMLYLHSYRFEYYHPKRNWLTAAVGNSNFPIISEKNNMEMYYYLHFNAIKNLCRELGTPFYSLGEFNISETYTKTLPDCARDMHLSPNHHINIFKKFKHAYENKLEPDGRPWNKDYFKLV